MTTSSERVAWSVRDWAQAVSCSRVTVHRLITAGTIKSRLMGRKRLILTRPEEYVNQLTTRSGGDDASATTDKTTRRRAGRTGIREIRTDDAPPIRPRRQSKQRKV